MIVFDNVSKYRLEHGIRRYILRNASFVIPSGARIAFLPSNRNDGNVLLNMISGVNPPDEGFITTKSSISWIFGQPIGMVNSLSARKNINIICGINGFGRGKSDKVAEMVASFTGLGRHIDEPMSTYKNEMRKRVEFALSLAIRFDYFLIRGNPSVGSGEFKQKSRMAFLKAVRQSGIILTSPNLNLVRQLCNSCLVSIEGEVQMYENLEEGIAVYRSKVAPAKTPLKHPGKKVAMRNQNHGKRKIQKGS